MAPANTGTTASPEPRRIPFADLQPTVEWQLNGRCNYDCSYCIQSRKRRVGTPSRETIARIVGGFATLEGGPWEIKISGGEPFAFDGLIKWAIPALMAQTPHQVSILTNFSAPLTILERFCRLTGERLRITSASLHLEHVAPDDFLDKARRYHELRQHHNPYSSFVVNSVVVPGKLAACLDAQARVTAAGFRYFPQLMKINGGVYPYSSADWRRIERLTGQSTDPRQVNRAPSYQGLHCEAGAWYFVVDQRGDAYSCRTGKRFGDTGAYLGNLTDGNFRLRKSGGACPYPICPCTVPANRGIVRILPQATEHAAHGT